MRVVAGAAALAGLGACREEPAAEPSGPLPVNVVVAVEKEVTEWDEFNGRVEAVESVEIRARVAGYLTEVRFKAGDIVEKGAPLFLIDPQPYQADYDLAVANLDQAEVAASLAELDFKRTEGLQGTGALAAQEIDRRAAALRQAQASVRAAKAAKDMAALNLDYTQIRSPIAGRVSDARLTVGNLVSATGAGPESVLTTVVSVDPVYIHVDADENAVLQFMKEHEGGERKSARETKTPAFAQLANEEGFPHEGYIDFVDNRLDPATGTLRLRGVFEAWSPFLSPGFFVRLRIPSGAPGPAVLLPDEVVGSQQGVRFVYVVKPDDTVERRNVEVGALSEGLRIVRSGVEDGERVVSTRLQMLRPGLAVQAVHPAEEPAPTAEAIPETKAPEPPGSDRRP